MRTTRIAAVLGLIAGLVTLAALPPVPVPAENPVTEEKRILGKLLFWDEQLSSDGTVACGTCHQAAAGGADPVESLNPGPDGTAGTDDDVLGSAGVAFADALGNPLRHAVFGVNPQVTGRSSMTVIGAAFVPEAFWDGRAGTAFDDPETGAISVAGGAALENQAVSPILNEVEMAFAGRRWEDVRRKLMRSAPLGNATDVPDDLRAALADRPSYGDLFAAAFGDAAITAERIGLAIASYERTLIAGETPWDRFTAGDLDALSAAQRRGWDFFRTSSCSTCHAPPLFTDNSFRNIGLRPNDEDPGRRAVTGAAADRGRFKVPTLRNVAMKPNHMHNGRVSTLTQALLWYRPENRDRFLDNVDPLLPVAIPPERFTDVLSFVTNGLTDPRVAAETFPFDRPALHRGATAELGFDDDRSTLRWNATPGAQAYNIYRGTLSALGEDSYGPCRVRVGAPQWLDDDVPDVGSGFFYVKTVVDGDGREVSPGADAGGRARRLGVTCPPVR